MRGMSAINGLVLGGTDHLSQSIADILTTPLGSRVMRRDYGSLLPELIDAPFNGAHRLMLFGAIATALMRWEPRIELSKVDVMPGSSPGEFTVTVEGRRTDVRGSTDYTRLTLPLNFRAT